jgi:hypothetical protein
MIFPVVCQIEIFEHVKCRNVSKLVLTGLYDILNQTIQITFGHFVNAMTGHLVRDYYGGVNFNTFLSSWVQISSRSVALG